MKESLLKLLICPVCMQEFQLQVISYSGDEIVEGWLDCPCGQQFPIIAGVPRILFDGLSEGLVQQYPDYYNRNADIFDYKGDWEKDDSYSEKMATMDRFGYEWMHFADYHCDNLKAFIAPLPDDFLNGKIGLDIGCGAGRHALQASQRGAEIVAIDLSQAVDAAWHNNRDNKLVHIIQADIGNLPLKPAIFDFIYSLGVLHHLSDPEMGYTTLIPYLKDGGAIFVWLYAFSARKIALEILRKAAKRLSNNNIRRLAFCCNLIDFGVFVNLFRFTQKMPFLGHWIKQFTPLRIVEYAAHGFRVSYTDWFDRLSAPITNYYKEDEMKLWLKRSELCNTMLLPEGDSWWWLYGERKNTI